MQQLPPWRFSGAFPVRYNSSKIAADHLLALYMYIHRALLLVFLILYIFTPSIQAWITESGSAWYRPYLGWAIVIAFVYIIQRQVMKKSQTHKKHKL